MRAFSFFIKFDAQTRSASQSGKTVIHVKGSSKPELQETSMYKLRVTRGRPGLARPGQAGAPLLLLYYLLNLVCASPRPERAKKKKEKKEKREEGQQNR